MTALIYGGYLSRGHYYHISPNEIIISQYQMYEVCIMIICKVYISDDKIINKIILNTLNYKTLEDYGMIKYLLIKTYHINTL